MTRVMGSEDDRDVSLLAQDQYFRQVRWTPALPSEEEVALVRCVERGKRERSKEHPDAQIVAAAAVARDRLVEQFQPLVIALAYRYVRYCHSFDLLDLVQEGNLGLLEALEIHDPARGNFKGLVAKCVITAICKAIMRSDRLIRLSHWVTWTLHRKRQIAARLRRELGREPLLSEIAGAMQTTEAQLQDKMLLARRQEVESLDALLAVAGEEIEGCLLGLFQAEVDTSIDRVSAYDELLRQAMECLTVREREVICLRYGLREGVEQGLSFAEVAQRVGCQKSSADRSERVAKAKLALVLAPILFGQAGACRAEEVA